MAKPIIELHLYALLRSTLFETSNEVFVGRYKESVAWPTIYQLAAEQGVLALAWDGLQSLIEQGAQDPSAKGLTAEQLPDRKLKLQWAFSVEQIEKRYRKQEARARELAAGFEEQGIRVHVLKGLSISDYYPRPEHRECGDLDCFLTLDPAKSHLHPEGAYEAG